VAELRGTYGATLAALGVDAASLPDPADSSDGGDAPYDDEYDDEYDDAPGGQARPARERALAGARVFCFALGVSLLTRPLSFCAAWRGAAAARQRGVVHHAGLGLHGANQRHRHVAPCAAPPCSCTPRALSSK
jgi:hypothetical protein